MTSSRTAASPSAPGAPSGPDDVRAAAAEVLATLVGRPGAQFRDGQLEAIEALVVDRRRVLVFVVGLAVIA
ncbi:MAG: hypothetical protein ACTHN8_14270, partial [Angustibacter sp.]